MSESWKALAACRGLDPELFFPGRGRSTKEAQATCTDCPVRAECLESGLHESHGIWGGLSERQRRKLKSQRFHQRLQSA